MQSLVSELSKYIIIIITAIYAYLGFIGFVNNDKKRSGEIYIFQPILILMFHFTGFLFIFLREFNFSVISSSLKLSILLRTTISILSLKTSP